MKPEILLNPQIFLDLASAEIKNVLYLQMVDGIKYQQIGNTKYEMSLFTDKELETYLDDNSFKVTDDSKTIYDDFVPLDSNVESVLLKTVKLVRL